MFLAAAIQMSAGSNRADNERRALSLLDRACEVGARLVLRADRTRAHLDGGRLEHVHLLRLL